MKLLSLNFKFHLLDWMLNQESECLHFHDVCFIKSSYKIKSFVVLLQSDNIYENF